MKVRVTITDYTTMTLKELEKEHVKQGQILLDMINDERYSKNDIDRQKSLVDYIYKKIRSKNRTISNSIGR